MDRLRLFSRTFTRFGATDLPRVPVCCGTINSNVSGKRAYLCVLFVVHELGRGRVVPDDDIIRPVIFFFFAFLLDENDRL